MADKLRPKDRAEQVALFRAQVLGPVLARPLTRGELGAALRELSSQHFTPPGADCSRSYSVPTLQRWYYAYKKQGLSALHPQPRSGVLCQALTEPQRKLLLDIRREYPSASSALILRTLFADGRIQDGAVHEATVRRLFASQGLDRKSLSRVTRGVRLRWQAERPNALWHADVCHGPALKIGQRSVPLRVHAILDDCARYVVAIRACSSEREVEMLMLMIEALRVRGRAPDALYLDNGPTYSGDTLQVLCGRLGIQLLHAKPHDPQARGKMERFFRTLRMGCLDHLGQLSSLHDVQVRLLAFLGGHYHRSPHSSLMGKSPAEVYQGDSRPLDETDRVTEPMLRHALTVHDKRRVRTDGTLSVAGVDFELDHGFLAGRVVTVGRTLLVPQAMPWVEHEGKRYPLHRVDPVANSRLKRKAPRPRTRTGIDALDFDPATALLNRVLGKHSPTEPSDE